MRWPLGACLRRPAASRVAIGIASIQRSATSRSSSGFQIVFTKSRQPIDSAAGIFQASTLDSGTARAAAYRRATASESASAAFASTRTLAGSGVIAEFHSAAGATTPSSPGRRKRSGRGITFGGPQGAVFAAAASRRPNAARR